MTTYTKFNVGLAAAAAIASLSTFARPAAAEIEYPWCALLSENGGGGALNCGFDTQEQCLQTIRGIGGWCQQNLRYPGPPTAQPQRRHKRRTNN